MSIIQKLSSVAPDLQAYQKKMDHIKVYFMNNDLNGIMLLNYQVNEGTTYKL
ncbi:hypothetical protein [Virgibacillus dokdonensis]|uniref:hypothetical protein n=1 Tax=Virgibacillus dokdonensis TaxID=302167 RepID=UPI002F92A8D0